MASIPDLGYGLDVTVNWRTLDFNSKGIFYTDSNGLGIVKRVTDKQQTFDT